MSNVLDDDKQQQIRALGRLGWTLSRIQEATARRQLLLPVVLPQLKMLPVCDLVDVAF